MIRRCPCWHPAAVVRDERRPPHGWLVLAAFLACIPSAAEPAGDAGPLAESYHVAAPSRLLPVDTDAHVTILDDDALHVADVAVKTYAVRFGTWGCFLEQAGAAFSAICVDQVRGAYAMIAGHVEPPHGLSGTFFVATLDGREDTAAFAAW